MRYSICVILAILIFYACSYGDDYIEKPNIYNETLTIDNFMYQSNADILSTYDISNPNAIKQIDEQRLNNQIESMIAFGGILFIGSGGTLIDYIINDNGIPEQRNIISFNQFSMDQMACDPFIIDTDLAYVLFPSHNGNISSCHRSNSIPELRVYNIEDINNPELLTTLDQNDPIQFAIAQNLLVVGDRISGFRILDISETENIFEVYKSKEFSTRDVIFNDGLLIIVTPTELRQYDYSDISAIQLISQIQL